MRSQTVEQVSRAELVDGSVISLRRLNSGDADDVVRLYESLTDDECYFRFFTMHPAQLQDTRDQSPNGRTTNTASAHSIPKSC